MQCCPALFSAVFQTHRDTAYLPAGCRYPMQKFSLRAKAQEPAHFLTAWPVHRQSPSFLHPVLQDAAGYFSLCGKESASYAPVLPACRSTDCLPVSDHWDRPRIAASIRPVYPYRPLRSPAYPPAALCASVVRRPSHSLPRQASFPAAAVPVPHPVCAYNTRHSSPPAHTWHVPYETVPLSFCRCFSPISRQAPALLQLPVTAAVCSLLPCRPVPYILPDKS